MSTHSGDSDFWLIVGFGAGIVMFFKGFRTYREYRVVEDTPEIPIRSIPMGLIHVHGRAKGEQLVTSPVTHTPCCFYKVVIEKWKTDSDRSGSWSHYRTDVDGPRFYLEDGSGHVLVEAHGSELDLEPSCRREVHISAGSNAAASAVASPAGSPATDAELLGYVTRGSVVKAFDFIGHKVEAVGPLGDPHKEQIRNAIVDAFTHPSQGKGFEALMALQMPMLRQKLEAKGPLPDPQQEQARLAALEAMQHPLGSPEFTAGLRRVSELYGKEGNFETWMARMQNVREHGLEGFNFSPTSGRFRFTEYCILPGHDYDITGTCAENPSPRDEHDRNLIQKGSNEPTFLISYKALPQVESGLRNRALGMIFGGAALSVVCLAILLGKLGLL
ncbi:MAG TPA: hypothetical protein VG204_17365 [Terriglobia bacterium]|nr:hypothetical protein [Terriglobia bacterium]